MHTNIYVYIYIYINGGGSKQSCRCMYVYACAGGKGRVIILPIYNASKKVIEPQTLAPKPAQGGAKCCM